MEITDKIRNELNGRLLIAMCNLSGSSMKKNSSNLPFSINEFRLETNFITGEFIWCHKTTEIYILPYLTSNNIKIRVYHGGKLLCSETINVSIQTNNIISGDWSTHDYVSFLLNLSAKKILEYEKVYK